MYCTTMLGQGGGMGMGEGAEAHWQGWREDVERPLPGGLCAPSHASNIGSRAAKGVHGRRAQRGRPPSAAPAKLRQGKAALGGRSPVVCTTPLGLPVEPEVYRKNSVSSLSIHSTSAEGEGAGSQGPGSGQQGRASGVHWVGRGDRPGAGRRARPLPAHCHTHCSLSSCV